MNTIQDIIVVIGILLGASLINKTKPILMKAVLIGLILSIGLPFLSNESVIVNISYWAFGVLTLTFSIFSIMNKKWLHFTIGIFAFASVLFELMHWPFFRELHFSMIFPFACYIVIVKTWTRNLNQLSILSILAFYELALLLRLAGLWLN